MSVTIITTVGSASANSYNALADITTHAAGTPWSAAWVAATNQDVLAVTAARVLDGLALLGWPVDATQALAFPRYGITHPSGTAYPTDSYPACVTRAHAHLAAWLASLSTTDLAAAFGVDPTAGVSSLSVGSGAVSITFRPQVQAAGRDFLRREVWPILAAGGVLGPVGSVRLVR